MEIQTHNFWRTISIERTSGPCCVQSFSGKCYLAVLAGVKVCKTELFVQEEQGRKITCVNTSRFGVNIASWKRQRLHLYYGRGKAEHERTRALNCKIGAIKHIYGPQRLIHLTVCHDLTTYR